VYVTSDSNGCSDAATRHARECTTAVQAWHLPDRWDHKTKASDQKTPLPASWHILRTRSEALLHNAGVSRDSGSRTALQHATFSSQSVLMKRHVNLSSISSVLATIDLSTLHGRKGKARRCRRRSSSRCGNLGKDKIAERGTVGVAVSGAIPKAMLPSQRRQRCIQRKSTLGSAKPLPITAMKQSHKPAKSRFQGGYASLLRCCSHQREFFCSARRAEKSSGSAR
jgi:hypothetical protein